MVVYLKDRGKINLLFNKPICILHQHGSIWFLAKIDLLFNIT